MIARLTGLIEKSKDSVLLDVQGVGYDLHVPETVMARLPENGSTTTMQIYTHVREDQISLFGFLTLLEKDVFKLLLSASGIGPKLALSILSSLDAMQILEGIHRNDKALFSGISGVGKKTVEKLFLEVREKAEKRLLLERGGSEYSAKRKTDVPVGEAAWSADLEQALLAFGYRENEVKLVVRETLKIASEFKDFEAALKYALQLQSGVNNKGMRGFA